MSTAHRLTRVVAVASTATAAYQWFWANKFEADKKVVYRDLLHTEAQLTNERLKVQGLCKQITCFEQKLVDQQQKTEDFISITACIIPMISLGMYAMVNTLLRERGW